MLQQRQIEIAVGLLICTGFFAFMVLAFKVSGLSQATGGGTYEVVARFDNIGDLKVRAPVTLAGVKVGEVASVSLDQDALSAKVILRIRTKHDHIPSHASAKILTQGILGSNYIGLSAGFAPEEDKPSYLHQGSEIEDTQSALILENLISQFLFNSKK